MSSSASTLVVSAAAGSGKTRVLVERYLRHVLEDQFSPDQILTITFTRKAAAQMKERIVSRLGALGLDDHAQVAETGPIQTIHGFCERLLRENALPAGLDPEFEILSESQASRLREQCVRQTLAFPPDDYPEAELLIEQLAGKRFFADSESPHAKLDQAMKDCLKGLRGTGIDPDHLLARHQSPFALLREWREALVTTGVPEDIQAIYEYEPGTNLADKLTSAYKKLKRKKPSWLLPSVDEDMASAEQTCGLVQLVCYAWKLLESEMRQLQALDFTALESAAVKLLANSPACRERVRRQYKVVLVDEAQDLNPVQYQLLEGLGIAKEMLVGDTQQSIYGFRQAEVQLFAEKMQASTPVRLSKNWRSRDGILAFVDALFGHKWQDKYTPMKEKSNVIDFEQPYGRSFEGVELWTFDGKDTVATASMIADLVEEVKAEGGCARDIAVLVRKSKYAMDLLKRLQRLEVPAKVAGGTEQFYARLEVRDLSNALRALSDPYDDYALLATLRSPFAGISLDSFVLLGAAKPVIEALQSYEALVEEDRRLIKEFLSWFNPLREYGDRLSAWEALSELLAKSPFLENIARRRNAAQLLANVRKLQMLAAKEPELGPLEYSERIREIQQLRHKEGDAPAENDDVDAVQITTVHKAKGLEYKVVVMPDTFDEPSHRPIDVEVDPQLKLVTTKFGQSSSMFHKWLDGRRTERELEEEWRVLYVALTRAQHRLCVAVTPKTNAGKFSREICKGIGFPKDPNTDLIVKEARRTNGKL